MKIKLLKFDNFYKAPHRAHYNDAGADVYLPEDIYVWKGDTVTVGLGFGLEIPDGMVGNLYPRSSLAKKGLVVEQPPIDSGYRGEIHVVIHNQTRDRIVLKAGDRIAQLVINPIILADFEEELVNDRGTGAFGSTGV